MSSIVFEQSEVLHAIDERFKQLEETLAKSQVDLHSRLHALEQKVGSGLKLREASKGFQQQGMQSVKIKSQEPAESDGDSETASVKVEVMEMDEEILDTQTKEYYSFGESR